MEIIVAPGHKAPSRFMDQQQDFEVKSRGMVVSRIFGVTLALLGHFWIDSGYLQADLSDQVPSRLRIISMFGGDCDGGGVCINLLGQSGTNVYFEFVFSHCRCFGSKDSNGDK